MPGLGRLSTALSGCLTGPGGAPIYGTSETPGGVATAPIGWFLDEAFPTDAPWELFTTIDPILAIDVGDRKMHPIIELLMSIHIYVQNEVIEPIAKACF